MAQSTKLSTTAKIGIGVGSGLVVLLGGGYLAGYLLAGDNLPRHASVAGVPIGGLTATPGRPYVMTSFGRL